MTFVEEKKGNSQVTFHVSKKDGNLFERVMETEFLDTFITSTSHCTTKLQTKLNSKRQLKHEASFLKRTVEKYA